MTTHQPPDDQHVTPHATAPDSTASDAPVPDSRESGVSAPDSPAPDSNSVGLLLKRKPGAAGPLGELLDHIARQAPEKYQGTTPAEPPEIEYFQKTWERLSVGLRLQQSHQQVPENAGPLNSTQLIHRALLLMQDTAPEYLRHFLAHVEALSWMEQFNANTTSPAIRPGSKSASKPPAKSSAKSGAKPAAKVKKKFSPAKK